MSSYTQEEQEWLALLQESRKKRLDSVKSALRSVREEEQDQKRQLEQKIAAAERQVEEDATYYKGFYDTTQKFLGIMKTLEKVGKVFTTTVDSILSGNPKLEGKIVVDKTQAEKLKDSPQTLKQFVNYITNDKDLGAWYDHVMGNHYSKIVDSLSKTLVLPVHSDERFTKAVVESLTSLIGMLEKKRKGVKERASVELPKLKMQYYVAAEEYTKKQKEILRTIAHEQVQDLITVSNELKMKQYSALDVAILKMMNTLNENGKNEESRKDVLLPQEIKDASDEALEEQLKGMTAKGMITMQDAYRVIYTLHKIGEGSPQPTVQPTLMQSTDSLLEKARYRILESILGSASSAKDVLAYNPALLAADRDAFEAYAHELKMTLKFLGEKGDAIDVHAFPEQFSSEEALQKLREENTQSAYLSKEIETIYQTLRTYELNPEFTDAIIQGFKPRTRKFIGTNTISLDSLWKNTNVRMPLTKNAEFNHMVRKLVKEGAILHIKGAGYSLNPHSSSIKNPALRDLVSLYLR